MADKRPQAAETAARIKALLKVDPISSSDRQDAARMDELRRILTQELQKCNTSGSGEATQQWRQFLLTAKSTLLDQLCDQVHLVTSCRTILGVLATVSGSDFFAPFVQFYTALVTTTSHGDPLQVKPIRTLLVQEFVLPFYDVNYASLKAVTAIADKCFADQQSTRKKNKQKSSKRGRTKQQSTSAATITADRLLDLLQLVSVIESQDTLDEKKSFLPQNEGGSSTQPNADENDDSTSRDDEEDSNSDSDPEDTSGDEDDSTDDGKVESTSKRNRKTKRRPARQDIRRHRSAWAKAWLSVLRLPLSAAAIRRSLRSLPVDVLPVSSQPLRFADFFMDAYSNASTSVVIPVLSLEGLFYLMTKHGLEYPSYYHQLYRIVKTPAFLYLQHRETFCRLLDASLARNDLLPAHVVAAFVKRLLRNCLEGPPHGCLFVLALVAKLLEEHPELSMLVHRGGDDAAEIQDKFDPTTDDPTETNALHSSAWELDALQHHSSPAVATLAQAIGTTDPQPLDRNEFLQLSYTTLFEEERGQRKKRRKTALHFVPPKGLLWGNDDVLGGLIHQPSETD